MTQSPFIGDRKLADPILVHDVGYEFDRLRAQVSWRSGGHSATTLVKHAGLRIVVMALRAGSRIQEHRTAGTVSIHALAGRVRLRSGEGPLTIGAGQLVTLDRDVPHDVEAEEDSLLLLTIAWPRENA